MPDNKRPKDHDEGQQDDEGRSIFVEDQASFMDEGSRAGKQYATLTDAALIAVRKDMCKALGC